MAKKINNSLVTSDALAHVVGGQNRVIIERVSPELDNGKFAIKAIVGESVYVEADMFLDGHDHLASRLLFKHETDAHWTYKAMTALGNDRFGDRKSVV